MKLCIDCKHHRIKEYPASGLSSDHNCHRFPAKEYPNYVTGNKVVVFETKDCYSQRGYESEDSCGADGKFWEKRDETE